MRLADFPDLERFIQQGYCYQNGSRLPANGDRWYGIIRIALLLFVSPGGDATGESADERPCPARYSSHAVLSRLSLNRVITIGGLRLVP